MTAYNNGEWWRWNGGECPVHPKSLVDTCFIHGGNRPVTQNADGHFKAGGQVWSCVIGFRVVKEHIEQVEAWTFMGSMIATEAEAVALRVEWHESKPSAGYLDIKIDRWVKVTE